MFFRKEENKKKNKKNKLNKEDSIVVSEFNNEDEKEKVIYKTPKILMIDCEEKLSEKVKKNGFDVEVGTFGTKYKVETNGRRLICRLNHSMPNIIEKDVVIVNMKKDEILEKFDTKPANGLQDGTHLYINGNEKEFNPRNMASYICRSRFLKLTSKSCIFIIFTDAEENEKYRYFEVEDEFEKNNKTEKISNYSFLPVDVYTLKDSVKSTQYNIVDKTSIFRDIYKGSKQKIDCNCALYIPEYDENKCIKILENIYGDLISYVRIEEKNGILNTYVILPQCNDMYSVINNLLTDILPNIYPEMFIDFVKNTWIKDEKYMFPKVKELFKNKEIIENEYLQKLGKIEKEIEKEYDKHKFMYDIIKSSGTGDKLVYNIKECLEYIGYIKVEDCDKNGNEIKEEDLHIYSNENEYFIAEVKGVNGPAIEDDCNVIVKYKSRNCKKLNKSSIHGVVFFNYHKNVEPEKREELGFTFKEIEDSIRDEYTLVGTYEFFKAIRLYQEGLLTKEHIKKSLEIPGLFKAIPTTFEYIGKIENILKDINVLCISLQNDKIEVGNELLIVEDNNYFKTKIMSLMVENVNVEEANKNNKVGIKIDKKIFSKSSQIYLIK